MAKILISWLAYHNDFMKQEGLPPAVNRDDSPNYLFHKWFYAHDKHILLYSGKGDEAGASLMEQAISSDFASHHFDSNTEFASIEGMKVNLVDFGKEIAEDRAILKVEPVSNVIIPGMPISMRITLSATANLPAQSFEMTISWGNNSITSSLFIAVKFL